MLYLAHPRYGEQVSKLIVLFLLKQGLQRSLYYQNLVRTFWLQVKAIEKKHIENIVKKKLI